MYKISIIDNQPHDGSKEPRAVLMGVVRALGSPICRVRGGLTRRSAHRQSATTDRRNTLNDQGGSAIRQPTGTQFYRRGYPRWIGGTKRRPMVRAERIAEMVDLLAAGVRERPKPSGASSGAK